jgi:tyrosine-protein kinase Etk/Wzc
MTEIEKIKQQDDIDVIDLRKFFFKALSNWYWFVIFIFSGLMIAYYVNYYSSPSYRVDASLLIKDNSDLGSGINQILTEMGAYNKLRKKKVQNEMAKLSSYSLAYKTLRELKDLRISLFSVGRIRTVDRYKDTPFRLDVFNIDSISEMLGKPVIIDLIDTSTYKFSILVDGKNLKKVCKYGDTIKIKDLTFVLEKYDGEVIQKNIDNDINEYYFVVNDINLQAKTYKNKLNVDQFDDKSSILNLSIEEESPTKAADYLNTLMETYIKTELEKKNIQASNAIKFIDNQLKGISDSLTKISDKLQKFRSTNKLVNLSMEGQNIYNKLYTLGQEKTQLQIKNEYYNYLLDYLNKKDDLNSIISPSVVGIQDQALSSLINKLLNDFTEYQLIKYSSKKENPTIKLAENNLQKTREAIIENLKNLKQSTELQLKEINKKINEVNQKLAQLPYTEKEMVNIQRYYDLNNEIYTYLLEKRAEAGIAKASNVPEAEVVDYAIPQYAVKVKPKSTLNYLIAFILGLIIPMLLIFVQDYFNNKITDKDDISSRTNIPIIGVIGHNQEKSDLIVYEKPKSSIAETFRIIRTNIQFFSPNKDEVSKRVKVIAINSTISGEGKTFVASNLAAIFAMSDKKTVLLGLDLRKPKLHNLFNISNNKGISNYLIGDVGYDEIIYKTNVENLYVIPSGPIPPNPAELIESKEMVNFVERLKEDFDIVIMDTPPIALVADALILNKLSDLCLFVVRQNYTTKQVVEFINMLHEQGKLPSVTILVNDLKVKGYYGYNYKNTYKYSYSYGYGYGYGYYGYGGGYYEEDKKIEEKNFKNWWRKIFNKKS